jgi:hypothetical protein
MDMVATLRVQIPLPAPVVDLAAGGHPDLVARSDMGQGGSHAAEQRDALAPFHSITSSANASNLSGISKPSA